LKVGRVMRVLRVGSEVVERVAEGDS
jgi:hypothetical protein